jgi:hypothetical protein
MTSHRTISLTLTLLAVFLIAAPASAFANSLLSGYGAPGEGNQAILGSALVGGARGGGGSSGTGGGGGSSAGSSSDVAGAGAPLGSGNVATSGLHGRNSKVSGSAPRDPKARGGVGSGPAGKRTGSRGTSGEASSGTARAYPVLSRDASQPTSGVSGGLGFSGEDVGYLLLALGALAFTGVLTRRLARPPVRQEGL